MKRCRFGRHGRRSSRHGREGHGFGRALDPDRVEEGLRDAESRLSLMPDQRPAWERLARAVRDGSEALRDSGLGPAAAGAPAPEKLARLVAAMEAGTAVLRRLRPAFDELYLMLGDDQRRALDGLAAQRGWHAAGG